MEKDVEIGIFGGTGIYDSGLLENAQEIDIDTPYGKPSDTITVGVFKGRKIAFLPRHGKGHFISPSKINFRANIDALKQLGVTDIVSVSAVGSLKEDLQPGKFVIVDQFIDRTFARKKTFFYCMNFQKKFKKFWSKKIKNSIQKKFRRKSPV